MVAAGVPTADFFIVNSVAQTLTAAASFQPPYVLKADGLAAGKGVFICDTLEQLRECARQLFEDKILGEAGREALLERFEPGYELSYLVLTNGSDYRALPLAQDHKRLLEGDRGPNTGGMGVIAPLEISDILDAQIHDRILGPVMTEMMREEMLYRGVLYVGVMVTREGPKVLEFNTRFGDPEAQSILPLVAGDWGEIFLEIAHGRLPQLKFQRLYSACLVLAAAGYPDHPVKGTSIHGDLAVASPSSYFLHAGTALQDGKWVTAGGRVINAVGIGSSAAEARAKAYQQAQSIGWEGMQLRGDIGLKTSSGH
jgi:phosphoribosylamine--glycine ligase